ncbi:MAG TPA: ABC transporter substrate-binding protein [Dehalococcoidia bacterium]|nr:ABC transporter substrate-binding protein [Dehalococcoidia bacterium]
MSDPIETQEGRWSMNRRALLRGGSLAFAGVAAAALIGCGSDDEKSSGSASSTAPAGTGTAAASNVDQAPGLPYPFNFKEPNKTAKDGGTMTVGVSWDVSTFDQAKSAAGGTITVPNIVADRLIGFKSGVNYDRLKLELKPELATSWERSPDGLIYTFKIRPNVKWQNVAPVNGRAFVAADAAYAYERYRKEGVHTAIWSDVDKIEATDASTLKITMKKPLVDFLNNLAGRYQTIFPKESVDDGSIEKKPIGTGPMIFQDAKAQQQVTLTKNPDYWQGKVHLDGWVFKIMPDIAARTAAFRAGQLDYGYGLAAKLSEAQNIEKSMTGLQMQITGGESGGYGFGMNVSNPKFKDERVRRAIALAQDHQTSLQLIYEGLGVALPDQYWTFVFDTQPDFKTGGLGQWTKASGDPAQAKQLLEAAGAANLTIDATYYTYAGYDATRPEVLTDQFRRAGITLNAKKVEYTEFNSQWVGAKLAEATTSGWGAPGFDADNYFYNQLYSTSPGNRHQIKDPQIDQWAEQQRVELDPAKRKDLHKKIWDRVWTDQMYRIPQAGGYAFELYQPWLRGFRSGGPRGTSSYFYDWGEQVIDMWLDK